MCDHDKLRPTANEPTWSAVGDEPPGARDGMWFDPPGIGDGPAPCADMVEQISALASYFSRSVGALAHAGAELLSRDRRSFLKDLALFGLCGWTLSEIRRYDRHLKAEASPGTTSDPEPLQWSEATAGIRFVPISPAMTLPIAGYALDSTPASRLPNAPRAYRQGLHEGVDLYAPYGTAVLAVGDGVVTQADHQYRELAPTLHRFFLSQSANLQTTPLDILGHLRGRCVELDHGVLNGVRWRSVYSHLSEALVLPGNDVRRGDAIGRVGNSGTTAGVRGTREDAHLHLEIRFQPAGAPETYLGHGLTEAEVRRLLGEVFRDA